MSALNMSRTIRYTFQQGAQLKCYIIFGLIFNRSIKWMDYLPFEIRFDLEVTGTKRVNMLIEGKTRKDIIVNFGRRKNCLFRLLLTLHLLLNLGIIRHWIFLVSSSTITVVFFNFFFAVTVSMLEVIQLVDNNLVLAFDKSLKLFILGPDFDL